MINGKIIFDPFRYISRRENMDNFFCVLEILNSRCKHYKIQISNMDDTASSSQSIMIIMSIIKSEELSNMFFFLYVTNSKWEKERKSKTSNERIHIGNPA